MSENIHQAINQVMQEVGYVKKQKGANLNYTYAGEAALISALRPAMVENGIYMHVLKIESVARENYTTAKGTAMVNTVISAIIRFAHVSGSYIDVASTGEGSDAGDKSANKAMTGLYKYAMRQTFCIETGDDPDKFASEERKETQQPKVEKPVAVVNPERANLVKEFSLCFNQLSTENKAKSKTIKGDSTIDQIEAALKHNQTLLENQK